MKRKILVLTSVALIALLLVSCGSNKYVGEYGGLIDDGLIGKWIFIKLTLNKDGTAETTIFGTEQSGYYEIENHTLTLTLINDWGIGVPIKGTIYGNEIVFSYANVVATLEKGRTYVDYRDLLNNLNGGCVGVE